MEIRDGRSRRGEKIAQKNYKRIKNFFEKNPDATKQDCVDTLNMCWATVIKYTKHYIPKES